MIAAPGKEAGMKRRATLHFASAAAALALLAAAPLQAQVADAPAANSEVPIRDPWVPPALRKSAKAVPTEGATLQAQVEQKLRADFDRADVNRTGTLTREQAGAAGLGFIAQHFDEIDTRKSGKVAFDDLKRFLRARGARLD
jgi:hypothetical protein